MWAMKVNDSTVRLADLPLSAVLALADDGKSGQEIITALQVAPLADVSLAVKVAEQCAIVAGVPNPDEWVTARLAGSWLEFSELFIDLDSDLPEVQGDGPFSEGDPSTTGS